MPAPSDHAHRQPPCLAPSPDAPGLPRLPDHLLDVLVRIARARGRVHRHTVHHQTLASLAGRHLVAFCDHDLVELTPLGLRVVAALGLERIRQLGATRRGRGSTDSTGQLPWAG
jgi:hypothetical protein